MQGMDTKITNIKQRILQLTEIKEVSKENFFKELGMSYGSFKGKSLDKSLNSDALATIVTKYPDVDPLWLLTGEGRPIVSHELREEPTRYNLRTDRSHESQEIPLYNLEASAGLVELFNNSGSFIPIDTLKIPNLPKCDGALFVTGDSMYPLLKSGDIIAYKEIKDLKNDLFWGEMYIVSVEVGGEYYTSVKYIQKSDLGDTHIKLVSQNSHHQPKDVELIKVRAVAIVKASVRMNTMR
jgi:phage repressor protein C with HTH and peptisase S24 domain